MRKLKEKILVSFSGGETSAFMINWLLLYMPSYEYRFIFANTGEENEETLEFVQQCAEFFNIEIIWVEYDDELPYRVVNFETAYRSHDKLEIELGWPNHPFRKYIRKFGIPNVKNPSCTRDMKERTIRRYTSKNLWKPSEHDLAIGIRADEVNRLGKHFYPLLRANVSKQMVNAFWDKMPFRLRLRGWEGNCKICWKKSIRKLVTIARYYPERFAFFRIMEDEFENYIPESRAYNESIKLPIRFFRDNKSVSDIFRMALDPKIEDAKDDSLDTSYQVSIYHDGTELDVFSGCVESCNAFN